MAQEKSQSLRPGTKLQSKERVYEILEVLGSGSFGITYKAIAQVPVGNIMMDIKFAIKEHFVSASCYREEDGVTVQTVPQAKKDVTDSRSDFITEANRLKRLCHKSRNIVSVNETFEANGTAYYVMEFLDGGNPSKCNEEDAIAIVKQIANALDEIHQEKVLHLDVKPDNIVLKKSDMGETYPVLIDFGISKHFDSKGIPTTKISAKGASPGYAPQEQYADITEFSPKYDIYALGAVLYYLTTGKNPPDAFKISPNQQELKKEFSGKVSSNVEKAILNAMKPSAMERTPTIQQFCDDLLGVDFVPVLNVSDSVVSFDEKKGQFSVSVYSNISWSVCCDEDWCNVAKKGNEVIISVLKNKETGNRGCNVIINGLAYQITQIIKVIQKGQGTTPIRRRDTWWELHHKQVYQASSAVLVACFAVGLYMVLKPDASKESRRLSEAIAAMNGPELKKYAELESIRAYLPYGEFLIDQQNYAGGIEYAEKVLATADSTQAKRLIESAKGHMAQDLNPILSQEKDKEEVLTPVAPEVTATSEVIPTPKETDEERFLRAQQKNDFKELLALAKSNYAKAYYPVAVAYYDRGNIPQSKTWVNKAIAANVDKSKAQLLLKQINLSSQETPQGQSTLELNQEKERRLQEALKDPLRGATALILLAEHEHYAPAYYHYARQLLQQGKTGEAKEFLKMSIEKGINVSQSKELLEILEE
ncbi:MAG: protein kinase [Muribaculaceae bacterium]|nr:protein kinase [Muribaculaceae bacterium]